MTSYPEVSRVVYNCDPESLGCVTQDDYAAAFVRECRGRFPNASVACRFHAGMSCVLSLESELRDDSRAHEAVLHCASEAWLRCVA